MKYLYSEPNRIKSLQHDDLGFSDSLSHSKKGEEVAGHKYISRKWVNDKWQYIYDQVSSKLPSNENKKNSNSGQKTVINKLQNLEKEEIRPDSDKEEKVRNYSNASYNKYKNDQKLERYEGLVQEENELRKNAGHMTKEEKERADEIREQNAIGRKNMYASISDAYNSLEILDDVLWNKYRKPYYEAKKLLDEKPNQKNLAVYFKAKSDYIKARDEYLNYADKTTRDIKEIEDLINSGKDFKWIGGGYTSNSQYVPIGGNIHDYLDILAKHVDANNWPVYF